MESVSRATSYSEALAFLYGRIDYERAAAPGRGSAELQLDRMRSLLERLGNPQDKLRIIHLAGTKGKGSTAAFVQGILTAAGYRTGLYSSPHLQRLEERYCIDGLPCSGETLSTLVEQVRPVVEAMDAESAAGQARLTFFEITTALAMLYFHQARVDFAVLEVGMGGRLDSTNVCQPLLAVITNISFDHTQQLGNTLAEIAGEKAGIIKPGVPVISGVQASEPRAVVQAAARQRGAPLRELGVDFNYQYRTVSNFSSERSYEGELDYDEPHAGVAFRGLRMQMLGAHQGANAALALAVAHQLGRQGVAIPGSAMRMGVLRTRVAARLEFVSYRPAVIIDTAHNVASVEALTQTLAPLQVNGRRRLIFAATREKDIAGMLRQLLPCFDQVLVTRYLNNPRCASPEEVAALALELIQQYGWTTGVRQAETPSAAWQVCLAEAGEQDLICVSGSFFLAAEMRALLSNQLVTAASLP